MKELSLENQIYLCKYHDIDSSLKTTMNLNEKEVLELISYYKKVGIYEKYRNLPDEEYEKLISKTKQIRNELKMKEKSKKRNQLLDLNDMLFDQLNILMDDSLSEQQLERELRVSKQVVSVSQTIINNANLLLQAKKHFDSTGESGNNVAELLRLDD